MSHKPPLHVATLANQQQQVPGGGAKANSRLAPPSPPPAAPGLDPEALRLVAAYLRDTLLGQRQSGLLHHARCVLLSLVALVAWSLAAPLLAVAVGLPVMVLALWPVQGPAWSRRAAARRAAGLFLGVNMHVAGWSCCMVLALTCTVVYALGARWGKDAVPLPGLFVASNVASLLGVLLVVGEGCFGLPAWRHHVLGYPYREAHAAVLRTRQ